MKRIVQVRFNDHGNLSEKKYSYFTDDDTIGISDWVLVVVGDIPRACMVVATSGISRSDQSKANKWIVEKIDLTEYQKKMEKRLLIAQIEDELDSELQRVQRYEVFKACATSSPVMQKLLKQLESLDPSITLIDISDKKA